MTLAFVGLSKFQIRLRDRFGKKMCVPQFTPLMKFEKDRNFLPFLHNNVVLMPFVYAQMNFQFSYRKKLDGNEVDSGWLVRPTQLCIVCC